MELGYLDMFKSRYGIVLKAVSGDSAKRVYTTLMLQDARFQTMRYL